VTLQLQRASEKLTDCDNFLSYLIIAPDETIIIIITTITINNGSDLSFRSILLCDVKCILFLLVYILLSALECVQVSFFQR
jgi:hypothetical protein